MRGVKRNKISSLANSARFSAKPSAAEVAVEDPTVRLLASVKMTA